MAEEGKREELNVRDIREVEKELKRRGLHREAGHENWGEEEKRARLQEHEEAHALWADTDVNVPSTVRTNIVKLVDAKLHSSGLSSLCELASE